MKKLVAFVLSAAMVLSLTACSGSKKETNATTDQTTTQTSETNGASEGAAKDGTGVYKAALLVNGTLGDKSFFDSANSGLEKLKSELGDSFEYKVEQMGGASADESKWEPTLLDYCDSGEYDVIICGTWQMSEPLAKAAAEYPDQKFIFFDEAFDYTANPDSSNIYNVLFKQNEVSFLVGAAAAMMTTDSAYPKVDPSNAIIGFMGGMENTVINDFLVGYIEGAKYVNPDIQVVTGFVGDFIDSAKGKDIGLSQYQNGVDVSYNVAGNAGLGLIEAANASNKYAFGVDSDQATLLPQYAANIPSSALKNVGNALYRAIKLDLDDSLTYGKAETLGLSEGGVELAKGPNYEAVLTEATRNKLAEIEQKIISGEIKVDTANGMSNDVLQKLKDSVAVK